MTPAQCRAARGLLNWSINDLAEEAGLSATNLRNFEKEMTRPTSETMQKLRHAFEAAGVEFIDGDAPGVRARGTAGA